MNESLQIVLVGLVAGIINTVAGGGSLLTLPAMIFLGLPAPVANATNRLGVLLQCAVASATFRKKDQLRPAHSWRELLACCLGAVLGATISVELDPQRMKQSIAVVMVLMLVVLLLKPKRWLQESSAGLPMKYRLPIFFVVGAYGGFLQAGVGVFLLASLVLAAGQNLVFANALKSFAVLLFTLPALAIYLSKGLVDWKMGGLLAIGSTLGGWLGARLAVGWGPQFIRWVLIVMVAISSSKLLGLW